MFREERYIQIKMELFEYLRRQAKEKANIKPIDYSTFFEGKMAYEILQSVVRGYIQMNHQEKMLNFYKFPLYTKILLVI